MATCPECDAEIEVDEFDVDKGDLISCPDCGSNLEVISTVARRARNGRRRGRRRRRRRREDRTTTTRTTSTTTTRTRDDDDGERRLGRVSPSPAGQARGLLRRPRPRGAARLGSVLVAYSGGVDSAFLAVTATRVLGERALCVTADSPSYPDRHRDLAIGTARAFNLRHEMVADLRGRAPGVPRQPGQPLLLLQARALHAPDGDRPRPRLRRRRRRQQRRRPRRLSSRPPGGARVRRRSARSTRPG